MSFMLIMRPDNSDRPDRYFPYYASSGVPKRGDSPSRQYFKAAGSHSSIDSSLDIVDDVDALFGKKYDFTRYISETGDTFIAKGFWIPGANIGQDATFDDQFTVMTKVEFPVWPMAGTATLFSILGGGFRASQFQLDIGIKTDGQVIIYANNSIGSRFFNQQGSGTISISAGDSVTFCCLCDVKQITGQTTFTVYANGVLIGSVNGDNNEGWRMHDMERQPWESLMVGLGGGNLFSNSQQYVEYLAIWKGLYSEPEEVKAGGTFETVLAAQAATVPVSWPAVGKVASGTSWLETDGTSSGTLVVPATTIVKSGEGYGEDGNEFIGSYVPVADPDSILMVDLEEDREDIVVLVDSAVDDDDLMVVMVEDEKILVIIEEKL